MFVRIMQSIARAAEAELTKVMAEWREAEEEARVLKEGLLQYSEDVNAAKRAASQIECQLAELASKKEGLAQKKDKHSKEADKLLTEIRKFETV